MFWWDEDELGDVELCMCVRACKRKAFWSELIGGRWVFHFVAETHKDNQ